jgi:hypothetical protein
VRAFCGSATGGEMSERACVSGGGSGFVFGIFTACPPGKNFAVKTLSAELTRENKCQ